MSVFDDLNEAMDDPDSDLAVDAVLVIGGVADPAGPAHPLRAIEFRGGASGTANGVTIDDAEYSVSVLLPPDVQVSPPDDTVSVAGAAYIVRRVRQHAYMRVLLDLEGPMPSGAG